MLSCKESTHLISESHDRTLAITEKLSLGMHLLICSGCRHYHEQIVFLEQACDQYKAKLNGDRDPS